MFHNRDLEQRIKSLETQVQALDRKIRNNRPSAFDSQSAQLAVDRLANLGQAELSQLIQAKVLPQVQAQMTSSGVSNLVDNLVDNIDTDEVAGPLAIRLIELLGSDTNFRAEFIEALANAFMEEFDTSTIEEAVTDAVIERLNVTLTLNDR